MKQSKKPPKVNFRRGREALKKEGGLKKASHKRTDEETIKTLHKLCRVMHIKYVITLEDQLQEDKAHLYLKEKTIRTLTADIKQKNTTLRSYEKFQKLNVKKVNKDWDEREQKFNALEFILRDKIEKLENGTHVKKYIEAYEDCLKKNDDFVVQNSQLIKERDEVTRAYNGLHQMGKFAKELNIDIKKYSEKLPENNMEFEQNHRVLESGKVQHSYKFTMPKKEKKKN
jgi:hypothetical protein